MKRAVLAALALLPLLAACNLAPPYKKPVADVPATWKTDEGWRVATPADAMPKGEWWRRFGDPQLESLVQTTLKNNPTLAVATARLSQARSVADSATSGLLPQVNANVRAARLKISGNRPLTRYGSPNFGPVQNDFVYSLGASYEADLFGRVGNTISSSRASAEQSAADLENTRLVLTADLASAYFNLRQIDTELDVLERSITLQRRALDFLTNRYTLGAASGLEVAQQQALIDNTLTQVDVLRRQRSQVENALATLTGTPAPAFSVAPDLKRVSPPPIPASVPSEVLQRRPDVASAERAMAAANAQIGIAKAAFYPSIVIAPFYGQESTMIETLGAASSTIWSLGVSVLQPLFNAGRLQANLDFAKAGYEATAASYQRVVLTAMQEVEDGLSGTVTLERAYEQALTAVASLRRVLDLSTTRYEGGVATYLDVITAQQALLNAERQASQLQGQRLLVAVFLVKALGGDWQGLTAANAGAQARSQ